jgi:hypothetical protein
MPESNMLGGSWFEINSEKLSRNTASTGHLRQCEAEVRHHAWHRLHEVTNEVTNEEVVVAMVIEAEALEKDQMMDMEVEIEEEGLEVLEVQDDGNVVEEVVDMAEEEAAGDMDATVTEVVMEIVVLGQVAMEGDKTVVFQSTLPYVTTIDFSSVAFAFSSHQNML